MHACSGKSYISFSYPAISAACAMASSVSRVGLLRESEQLTWSKLLVFLLYISTQEGLNTSSFNQSSVATIFQCIVNATHTPVSTQSSGNMGKKLSQNREMGRSCSEYSQDTSTQFTIVTDNGVTPKVNRG